MQLLIGVLVRRFSYRESFNAISASQSPEKASHDGQWRTFETLAHPNSGAKSLEIAPFSK
jgi:hypothetical protein